LPHLCSQPSGFGSAFPLGFFLGIGAFIKRTERRLAVNAEKELIHQARHGAQRLQRDHGRERRCCNLLGLIGSSGGSADWRADCQGQLSRRSPTQSDASARKHIANVTEALEYRTVGVHEFVHLLLLLGRVLRQHIAKAFDSSSNGTRRRLLREWQCLELVDDSARGGRGWVGVRQVLRTNRGHDLMLLHRALQRVLLWDFRIGAFKGRLLRVRDISGPIAEM
jgi:hypothetical protein